MKDIFFRNCNALSASSGFIIRSQTIDGSNSRSSSKEFATNQWIDWSPPNQSGFDGLKRGPRETRRERALRNFPFCTLVPPAERRLFSFSFCSGDNQDFIPPNSSSSLFYESDLLLLDLKDASKRATSAFKRIHCRISGVKSPELEARRAMSRVKSAKNGWERE